MKWSRTAAVMTSLVVAACGTGEPEGVNAQQPGGVTTAGEGPVCELPGGTVRLPDEVRETSGLAYGAAHGLLWTHNDANNAAELFGVDEQGRLVQRVRIAGATNEDWEDISAAPCGDASCLYIADVGDNDGDREHVTIYVVREPERNATSASVTTTLRARYPDGPRDAESLFVAPSGDLYIVTKGRAEAVELYRYAQPHRPEEVVTMQLVRELFPRPDNADRVTAAVMAPDGRWVAIRSHLALGFYRTEQLLDPSSDARPAVTNLRDLGHVQGESVAMTPDGAVWLTSEAESGGSPVLSRIECTFPQ